jgi:Zn-dependent protease
MRNVAVFSKGYLQLGRLAGVPVRMHWTAPIGAFVFCGFRFSAVAWACFFGIILAHELGHALVVKAARCSPTQILLLASGGLCAWRGEATPIGRAAIAWGGVWAQLVLLGAAALYLSLYGWPSDLTGYEIAATLTAANTWSIVFNLLPIAPLDGAEAWALPVLLGRKLRRAPEAAVVLPRPSQYAKGDELFEAGDRRDEVRAVASSLLEEARRS